MKLSKDMKGVTTLAIVLIVVVAAVASAAIVGFVLLKDDNNNTGDYYKYDISGRTSGLDIGGTCTMKIVGHSGSMDKWEYTYDMYLVNPNGTKTSIPMEKMYMWAERGDFTSGSTKTGTDTITTAYGVKNVDVYFSNLGGMDTSIYMGQDGIPYKMVSSISNPSLTMNMDLVDTNKIEK